MLSLRGVITNSGYPISRKTKANEVLLWFKLQLFEELNNSGETLTQNENLNLWLSLKPCFPEFYHLSLDQS